MRILREKPERPRDSRRRAAIGRAVERLEGRDLLALMVGPVSAIEKVLFSGTVAKFAAADVTGTASQLTATINWGDGTAAVTGSVVPDPGGGFDVIGQKTFTSAGQFAVVVAVAGTSGSSVEAAGTADVTNAPLTAIGTNLAPTQDVPFTSTVATFTAPGATSAGGYIATINWGTGLASTAGTIVPVTGQAGVFGVVGSFDYTGPGPDTITVAIEPVDGDTPVSVTSTAVISPSLVVAGTSIAAMAGSAFSGAVGSFTDGGGSINPGDFSATITWGAGLPKTPATITSAGAGQFGLTGSFLYPAASQFTPTIAVTRVATGQTASASDNAVVSATVVGSGLPISATAGQTFTGAVATFADTLTTTANLDPGAFVASINWGDGHVSTGSISYVAGTGFTVTGSNTYATAGTFPVAVTLTRLSGDATTVIQGTATVYQFAGSLAPVDLTGPSKTPGVTDQNRPSFVGTTEPNAIVRLFARSADLGTTTALGETIAGGDGVWQFTSLPLADGSYSILGVAIPTTGSPYPAASLTTVQVDTVAPRVVSAVYQPETGMVTVTIRDDRSGLDPLGLSSKSAFAPDRLEEFPVLGRPPDALAGRGPPALRPPVRDRDLQDAHQAPPREPLPPDHPRRDLRQGRQRPRRRIFRPDPGPQAPPRQGRRRAQGQGQGPSFLIGRRADPGCRRRGARDTISPMGRAAIGRPPRTFPSGATSHADLPPRRRGPDPRPGFPSGPRPLGWSRPGLRARWEARVAFDRAVDPALIPGLVGGSIGFDAGRPGAPRRASIRVAAARLADGGRTLVLVTDPHPRESKYLLALPGIKGAGEPGPGARLDLSYDLGGVEVTWTAEGAAKPAWSGWWPVVDPNLARILLAGSADHDRLWPMLATSGSLTLRTLVMLPAGAATVRLESGSAFEAAVGSGTAKSAEGRTGRAGRP